MSKIKGHQFLGLVTYYFLHMLIDVLEVQDLYLFLIFLLERHETFIVTFAIVWLETNIKNLFKFKLVYLCLFTALSLQIKKEEICASIANKISQILIKLHLGHIWQVLIFIELNFAKSLIVFYLLKLVYRTLFGIKLIDFDILEIRAKYTKQSTIVWELHEHPIRG